MCVHWCGGQKSTLSVVPQELPPLDFWDWVSHWPVAKLAYQPDLGILLSLLPQTSIHQHALLSCYILLYGRGRWDERQKRLPFSSLVTVPTSTSRISQSCAFKMCYYFLIIKFCSLIFWYMLDLAHMPQSTHRGQRGQFSEPFSSSTIGVSEIKLGSHSEAASALTHWTILLTHPNVLLVIVCKLV